MKIVILSELYPRDWLVVQEIIRNFDNVTLIHLTPTKGKGRKKSGSWLNTTGRKVFNRIYKFRLRKSIREKLHKELSYQKISFPSKEINSEEGQALLRRLNPDILFTSRAPILKKAVYQIPKLAAINAHIGIPPNFRGNHTLFWALYYQDFKNVGGCLHYISQGADTGNILVKVHPDLSKEDGELSLDIKITTLLGKAAVQLLHKIQQNKELPSGVPQSKKGRNFKSSERTIYYDLKFLILKFIGFRKIKSIPERRDFFV